MALIPLTPDDLCAMMSSPFPCEEGTIIDPIAVAHFLGLVETGAAVFEDAESGVARTDLLALAVRFQSASKMSGIGTTAEDLAGSAARLIDAAMAR